VPQQYCHAGQLLRKARVQHVLITTQRAVHNRHYWAEIISVAKVLIVNQPSIQ